MNLYLVRHGKTSLNKEGRIQGRTDIELIDEGRKTAQELNKEFENIKLDICFASPLKRTKETAAIIIGDKEIPVIYDDLLLERSFGELEGTLIDNDKLNRLWNFDIHDNIYNEETIRDLFNRAKKVLDLLKSSGYENILVVTHGALMKAIHFNIVGYDEKTDLFSWFPENAKVYKYTI